MVLRRFLKTIKDEENSFEVPRSFQKGRTIEKGTKTQEFTHRGCLMHIMCTGYALPTPFVCVVALFCGQKLPFACFSNWLVQKSQFSSLKS